MEPVAPARPLELLSDEAKGKTSWQARCVQQVHNYMLIVLGCFFLFFCFPGAFPVSAHGSQFPKGPGGVFPRHPQQQELPERGRWGGLLSRTERFPGKLALPRLPPPRFLCHRHPNLLCFVLVLFFF